MLDLQFLGLIYQIWSTFQVSNFAAYVPNLVKILGLQFYGISTYRGQNQECIGSSNNVLRAAKGQPRIIHLRVWKKVPCSTVVKRFTFCFSFYHSRILILGVCRYAHFMILNSTVAQLITHCFYFNYSTTQTFWFSKVLSI